MLSIRTIQNAIAYFCLPILDGKLFIIIEPANLHFNRQSLCTIVIQKAFLI